MQYIRKKAPTLVVSSILLLLCSILFGQENSKPEKGFYDDEPILTKKDTSSKKTKRKHSPQLATISSAIVPGLGQAYNKKYWKIPIIWGAGIALYGVYDYNNNFYNRLDKASKELDAGDEISDPALGNRDITKSEIDSEKNKYYSNKTETLIFLGLLYVANIVDAMVDAHLLDYDVSENLSLHWEPIIIPPDPQTRTATSVGFKVKFKF